MISNQFFTGFLKMSHVATFVSIILLIIAILAMYWTGRKKVNFSSRMLISLFLGLSIGIFVELIFAKSANYINIGREEISLWYSLLGSTFVSLIQMMAIPVVFFSIFFVIVDFKGNKLGAFTRKTLFLLLGTTSIAAMVGIIITNLFGLSHSSFAGIIEKETSDKIQGLTTQNFPTFALNLIPNNITLTFSSNSAIISTVIIAILFAIATRFLITQKNEGVIKLVEILHSIKDVINTTLLFIIDFMPYAVIALVSKTIISNGLESIISMATFIGALYTAVIVMLVIYIPILLLAGVNPFIFYKKAYPTMVFAFSSRSSVGTMPFTIETLESKMGVSSKTANFVASVGTSVGMNGCAGVFPSMLAVIVAGAAGVNLNISFYFLVVIVVTLGSIGIAGVPGTATVAATVTLNGVGLGKYFDKVALVFGIDPLIDMGRTMLNVTGSMVSAVVVDRLESTMNMDKFNNKIS
ncbi:cation:dicarboxylate symporter family transporter [Peptostreptococcus equinus]|uniref:L-cystine uptake protein TcyP n=1 Tax=Peptostreptococcus equinus TaxID=3003601 RepID=A0ABY7JU98_9FIRM|nr:cation:dicarboxylase symporter family transporter [Peptostreptococcus sp. CBA3647]WAW15663.1 cation:dicarboxylase symporter family transporter [Peptostreptococcus sp. CBA3647]